MLNPSDVLNQQGVIPEYPDLKELTDTRIKPEVFPLQELPPLLGNAAKEIAAENQLPDVLAGLAVIGAASHLAQSRVDALHPAEVMENDQGEIVKRSMPTSLNILALADSGDRKSTAYRLAYHVINKLNQVLEQSYERQQKELQETIAGATGADKKGAEITLDKLQNPSELLSGGTFEAVQGNFIRGLSSASWTTDEGGQFFGGHSMQSETRANALGGFIQFFDSGSGKRLVARSNAEGSGTYRNRRLTIFLMAQEFTVRESLKDPLFSNQGFLPRFLLGTAESKAGTRLVDLEAIKNPKKQSLPALKAYWARCKEILSSPSTACTETAEIKNAGMPLSDDALEGWASYYNMVEAQLHSLGDYAHVKPFASRSAEIAARLATIFTFFDGKQVVDAEAMNSAVKVAYYSLKEWLRYTTESTTSTPEQEALEFIKWLQDKPDRLEKWRSFTASDASRNAPAKFRGQKGKRLREQLLKTLIEHNYILAGSGDAKDKFILNPKLITELQQDAA